MAMEYGKDWRLYIGDGQATEEFGPLGGEGSWSFKRSSTEIDGSSKDDGTYALSSYGQQKITISVSGKVKLPDAGLKRINDQSKAAPPHVKIKLMKGEIVKFHGEVGIGNNSFDGDKDQAVTYSFDMSPVAVPIVDDLVAVA